MSNRFASILALAAFCFPVAPLHAADSTPLRPWTNYQTIMWIGDTAAKQPAKLPLFYQRLHEMGINTAMAYGDGNPQPLLDQGFPYYVENVINKGLCLKWNSNVRDWDKFVTTWTKTGRAETAFVRDYSLDDPAWRSWARGEMQRVARKNAPHNPLAYDIRDELSTTISANPFDYDFSPITLAKFRDWLKEQYRPNSERALTPSLSHPMGEGARRAGEGSDQAALTALNAEWETKFASWNEVKPFTTDQIKNRMASGDAIPRGQPDWQAVQRIKFDPAEARKNPTRWNFSPWCDFRTYMDISLASALDDIRQASHGADPRTPVGIEGTQMPSAFGGYDLWRLSQVLDWVEPYDIGNAREILGSFMPGKTFVTTVFEKDTDHARRRLWHLLLEGDRGCIVWWSEDCIDWKSPDYALTPKAKALAPALKEMTSPLAQLFLRAEREYDPIAIHYSQPSIQVDWLLESTVDGSTWHRRFSSFEADHNRMAKVRNAWLKAFQDLGFSPRFVSTAQIEKDGLAAFGVLVLPHSFALSPKEYSLVTKRFHGSIVFDDEPGLFDEHGKFCSRDPVAGQPPPKVSAGGHCIPFAIAFSGLGSEEESQTVELRSVPTSNRPPRQTLKPSHDYLGDVTDYLKHRSKSESVRPGTSASSSLNDCLVPVRLQMPLSVAIHESGKPNDNVDVSLEKNGIKVVTALPQNPSTRTRIHRYALGSARLVAFERNIDYHMSEDLKQAGGNEALEKPIDLEAKLAKLAHVYDLRAGKYLGQTDRIAFHLDPWQPSLFALLPEKVDEARVVELLLAASSPKQL